MKNKITAALLAWFLGPFGGHKFYLGETKSGVLRLLFWWTFIPSILALIDLALILGMSEDEFNNKYNYQKTKEAV